MVLALASITKWRLTLSASVAVAMWLLFTVLAWQDRRFDRRHPIVATLDAAARQRVVDSERELRRAS